MDKYIIDALTKLKPSQYNSSVDERECSIYSWPQSWPNTTCGFGGIGGQMITTAQCVVVIGPERDACIYHSGRLAHYIECPSELFWDEIRYASRKLPGGMGSWAKYHKKKDEEPNEVTCIKIQQSGQ